MKHRIGMLRQILQISETDRPTPPLNKDATKLATELSQQYKLRKESDELPATERQIKYARHLSEKLALVLPGQFTKQATSDFISKALLEEKQRNLSNWYASLAANGFDKIQTIFSALSNCRETEWPVAMARFWNSVYDTNIPVTRVDSTLAGPVSTLKAINAAAKDQRTRSDYITTEADYEMVNQGEAPLLFAVPSPRDIDVLITYVKILNLDPSLSENDYIREARSLNLIEEDTSAEVISQMRQHSMDAKIADHFFQPGFSKVEDMLNSNIVFATIPDLFGPSAATIPRLRAAWIDGGIENYFTERFEFPLETLNYTDPPPPLTDAEVRAGLEGEDVVVMRLEAVELFFAALRSGRTIEAEYRLSNRSSEREAGLRNLLSAARRSSENGARQSLQRSHAVKQAKASEARFWDVLERKFSHNEQTKEARKFSSSETISIKHRMSDDSRMQDTLVITQSRPWNISCRNIFLATGSFSTSEELWLAGME